MAMADLSAAATLDLWQAAEELAPVERSLALAAARGEDPDELAMLPLGQRDARLLALHGAVIGGMLEATAPCPECGALAEFVVDPDALLAGNDKPGRTPPLDTDGFVVSWRPLDSADVATAARAGDAATAERVLLTRCVIDATGPHGETDAVSLPPNVRDALASAMAQADPLAEVLVDVSCPVCEFTFVADLDVGAFVWAELRARAERLVREVAVLARAYGWTEAEVLALDDRRRAVYLELAREFAP